jgi:hypothetical protein
MHRTEPTVHRRTLGRAIEIAGGEHELAAFLSLPLADIRRWYAGEADFSTEIFLALVDIVSANALPAKRLK